MAKTVQPRKVHSAECRERALTLARALGPKRASQEVGISVHTINNWLSEERITAGVPLRQGNQYAQSFREEAVQLAQSSSAKEAASMLGVSKGTIQRWVRSQTGIPKRHYSRHTKQAREVALALVASKGFIAAAHESGVPETTLRSWDNTPKRPRKASKSYSAAEKHHAIQRAKEVGIERAAAEVGVPSSSLRRWGVIAGEFEARFGAATTSDISFSWVSRDHPRFERWRELAALWAAGQTSALRAKLEALRRFFKNYLVEFDLPNNPVALLTRDGDFPDFFRMACPSSKAGITYSNYVHKFLEWVLLRECSVHDDRGRPIVSPVFHNPIARLGYEGIMEREESAYSPLPHGYIEELRAMLAAGLNFSDWRWAQTAFGAKLPGRGAVAPDWFEVTPQIIDESDPDCVWRKRLRSAKAGGHILEMWSPVRWVALLVKLMLPLRTTQVRMLDSGELDELKYIYDPSQPGRTAWVANDSPLRKRCGVNKQPLGVFRHIKDGAEYGAVLYVNTNKTADSRKSGAAKGYELPWFSTDPIHSNPYYWLSKLRDWQSKYNPIAGATAWTELDARHIVVKSQFELARYPNTCFLFRLPEAKEGQSHLPIGKDAISRAWYLLAEKFERRLAQRGETHANGSAVRLVKVDGRSTDFPLHSLRVSLITALVVEGKLPLPVMQKLVGHSRMLMTLYYTKIGAIGIGEALGGALHELRSSADKTIQSWLQTTDHARLVKEAIANNATAFSQMIPIHPASRNAAGWMLMAHGLCLVGGNASPLEEDSVGGCFNGGESVGTETNPKFAPVPGGARNCVRCRWFVTAPQYIGALVAHFNVISYHCDEARDKCLRETKRVEELRASRLAAEDCGSTFTQHAELHAIERGYECAMQEFNERVLDLGACYRLTARCLQAVSERGPKLVAVGGLVDLRVATEQVDSELLQLAGVCEAVETYPDFNAGKAVFRRSQLLDAALHRDGRPPIFMALSEEQQLRCGNEYLRALSSLHSPDDVAAGRRAVIGAMDGGYALSEELGLDLGPMLKSLLEPLRETASLRLTS